MMFWRMKADSEDTYTRPGHDSNMGSNEDNICILHLTDTGISGQMQILLESTENLNIDIVYLYKTLGNRTVVFWGGRGFINYAGKIDFKRSKLAIKPCNGPTT